MTVEYLEKIAINSHKGELKTTNHNGSSLADYEHALNIVVAKRIDSIKKKFPNMPIIAADLGCAFGNAASELNKMEGVEGFGIDLFSSYNSSTGLPTERYILGNLNNLSKIPDNSFHYAISFNVLAYTKITESLPEIYRILKPGGEADLDIEHWFDENYKELTEMDLINHTTLVAVFSGFEGTFTQYVDHLRELHQKGQTNRDYAFNFNRDKLFTRFILQKPKD